MKPNPALYPWRKIPKKKQELIRETKLQYETKRRIKVTEFYPQENDRAAAGSMILLLDEALEVLMNAANYGLNTTNHVPVCLQKRIDYAALFGKVIPLETETETEASCYLVEYAVAVEERIPGGTRALESGMPAHFLGWARLAAHPKEELECPENGVFDSKIRIMMNALSICSHTIDGTRLPLCCLISETNLQRMKRRCRKSGMHRGKKKRDNLSFSPHSAILYLSRKSQEG